MTIGRITKLILLIAALALVAAACGNSSDDAGTASQDTTATTEDSHEDDADDHEDDADNHDEEFSFGEPAMSATADRVIEVDANDDLTFDPAEITVAAGETITFVVTNTGVVPHDFTIGDEATQDAHEEEMAEMIANDELGEHDDPNAVVVFEGETKEITWTFSEAGTVIFGCHQPGHYAGGMKGTFTVEG